MLLERLRDYAEQLGMPPPMYERKFVRYTILLDADGQYLGIIDSASATNKNGISMDVPNSKRSSNVLPFLLCDDAEYVFGLARDASKESRVQKKHRSFVALTQECAQVTEEASVKAIAHFLTTLDRSALELPENFDRSARLVFEVDGVIPIELPSVRDYWAKVAAAGDATKTMQCLVCGNQAPPVEVLPIAIHGIPGGQKSGMALISANKDAFWSYGLKKSFIAPTCEDCGQRFGTALNTLLNNRETHLNIETLSYIFWAKADLPFSASSLLSQAKPEDIREFLLSPWKKKKRGAPPDHTPFYAAVLSATGPRVVLRDWMESTLSRLVENLTRFFYLQQMVDNIGELCWFSLWQLTRATVPENSKEDAVAAVGEMLLHLAFQGGNLPLAILRQVLRRIRAERKVIPSQAALLKMVLLTQPDLSWIYSSSAPLSDETRRKLMAELDLNSTDPAYLCGRLLAELEEIQTTAQGPSLSSTVADRYFGTASTAPALVFGRLLRGSQNNLSKLKGDPSKAGAAYRLEVQLESILENFPEKRFPSTLTLLEQGRFGLGYYQQRAADRKAAIAGAAAKKAAQGQKKEAQAAVQVSSAATALNEAPIIEPPVDVSNGNSDPALN